MKNAVLAWRIKNFFKIYVELGLSHPLKYIETWIDETKGYWNAVYNYWYLSGDVYDNTYGIERSVNSNKVDNILNKYLWLYSEVPVLQIFRCIGFNVWLIILTLYITVMKSDKIRIFCVIPVLIVVFSLVVATPVAYELRYVYAVFRSIPFLVVESLN